MFQTTTQHIARSQSKFALSRPSISAIPRRHVRKINSHHPTSTASRQLHHNHHPELGQHPSHPLGDQPPPPISTVNDDEISHFSRLSSLWWDESGEFALLHKMNPHRIRFIREKLLEALHTHPDATTTTATAHTISSNPTQSLESPRVMEGMDVLDVGCGGGILSEVRFYRLHVLLLLLLSGLLTDGHPFLYPVIRVSRVSAPIRSPSTHQQRTLASRRVMPLLILVLRGVHHPRRHRGHSRSGMRLLRHSFKSQSDSISSVRWRSLSTSITRRAS
jgi:hypothetical protein